MCCFGEGCFGVARRTYGAQKVFPLKTEFRKPRGFRNVSSFLDPWCCLGLGLRQEQVRVTGAGPQHQHQGAPYSTNLLHQRSSSPYTTMHQRSSSGAPPVPAGVRAPALGSCHQEQPAWTGSRPEPLIQPVSSHSLCKQQLKPAHPSL